LRRRLNSICSILRFMSSLNYFNSSPMSSEAARQKHIARRVERENGRPMPVNAVFTLFV
jgi:hypothetical protein